PSSYIDTSSLHDALPISVHRQAPPDRHVDVEALQARETGDEHHVHPVRLRQADRFATRLVEVDEMRGRLLEQATTHLIDLNQARDRKSTRLNSSHQIISY